MHLYSTMSCGLLDACSSAFPFLSTVFGLDGFFLLRTGNPLVCDCESLRWILDGGYVTHLTNKWRTDICGSSILYLNHTTIGCAWRLTWAFSITQRPALEPGESLISVFRFSIHICFHLLSRTQYSKKSHLLKPSFCNWNSPRIFLNPIIVRPRFTCNAC